MIFNRPLCRGDGPLHCIWLGLVMKRWSPLLHGFLKVAPPFDPCMIMQQQWKFRSSCDLPEPWLGLQDGGLHYILNSSWSMRQTTLVMFQRSTGGWGSLSVCVVGEVRDIALHGSVILAGWKF